MKKIFLGLTVILLSCSCNYRKHIKELEEENASLKKQVDSLKRNDGGSLFLHLEKLMKDESNSKQYPLETKKTNQEYLKELTEKIEKSGNTSTIADMNAANKQFFELEALIESIRNESIEKSGGWDANGQIKNYKDKNSVNTVMVDGGKGAKLRTEILACKQMFNQILSKYHSKNEGQIPLDIDIENAKAHGMVWEEYCFRNMPLAAIQPLFTKFRNDAQYSLIIVLEALAE